MLGFFKSLGKELAGPSVAEELVEIDREWGAIKRFFDAAIMDGGGDVDDDDLASQLANLASKLRHIVALVHCGGRLPASAVAAGGGSAALAAQLASWDRLPPGKPALVARCKAEGARVFALVCQHAKLNLPPGSRSVLAGFMADYIEMCESGESSEAAAAAAAQSSSASNTPPHQHLLVREQHSVREPLINFLAKTVNEVIRCRQFALLEERREKFNYTRLIRCICEAVAQHGGAILASSAAPTATTTTDTAAASHHHHHHHHHHHLAAPQTGRCVMAERGQLTLAWLLDLAETYGRADDLYPCSAAALDATLRGHLALALSPFDLVEVRAAAMLDSVLSQLGFTFVTLCRLDENADFTEHVAVAVITMRYLDALCVFAPHIVDAAELPQRFFRFLLSTVVEMVKLSSDRSFTVSVLLLASMMDACAPGSPLPALIAQAVVAHSEPVADVFFARLTDLSPGVRTAAANFLLVALRACPALFAALVDGGVAPARVAPGSAAAAAAAVGDGASSVLSSSDIGLLFPASFSAPDDGAGAGAGAGAEAAAYSHARRRVILAESRRCEPCPSVATLGPAFAATCASFVRQLRRALCYDLQQFTAHDAAHCALLSGIVVELLALPDDRGAVAALLLAHTGRRGVASANSNGGGGGGGGGGGTNGVLADALAPLAQHVETRLARLDAGVRAVVEDAVAAQQGGAADAGTDAALLVVSRRMPAELQAFARGTVHLAALLTELRAALRAREAQIKINNVDLDG